MHVKSVVSAVALSAAMLFSGSAFAQTMFNGVELSADDLPAVTERCEQLTNAQSTEPLADSTETADDTAGGSDANVDDAPAVNEMADATATVDLDTITIEQCTEAGIPAAM